MQAKTTRDLWSADDPGGGARRSRGRLVGRAAVTTTSASSVDEHERQPPARRARPGRTAARVSPAMGRTALGLMVVALALAALLTARLTVRGEVFPGVRALGVSLGGLSETEARERLQARANEVEFSTATVTYGDQTWTPTLAELGVQIDVDASVSDVMGFGREHHRVSGLLRPLGIGEGPVGTTSAVHVETSVFTQTLQRLALEAGIAPVDAGVAYANGQWSLTPERDGVVFDIAAAQNDLLDQVVNVATPTLRLTGQPQSATIRLSDLTAVQPAVEAALSVPLVFVDGARRWSLAPEDLAGMIRFVAPQNGQAAMVTLDHGSLRAVGERLAKDIDRAPEAATIDESGAVARLVTAQEGRAVNVADFVTMVSQAFTSGQHEVAIPMTVQAPELTTEAFLTSIGVTDVLATGTSDFAGSEAGRATNVAVAADLIDGVMVAPGETFSFNYAIGEINATPGFVPAGASENGISGTANGGGVCQVTTTVFRAALQAGLPIEEWWPHAYRNIYYEQGGWSPGFDASVQQPDDDPFAGSDFIFRNPTDGWLLVRSTIADGTKLSVAIVGAPTGYTVQIDDPVSTDKVTADGWPAQESVDPNLPPDTVDLVQPARDGMTMTVNRRVIAADGSEVLSDSFVSTYEPQGASYRVSPDMAGSTAGEQ